MSELKDEQWQKFVKNFGKWITTTPERLSQAVSDGAELILARAKGHYLTGGSLNIDKGYLRSSLTKEPKSGSFISGDSYWVTIGTKVFYGAAWEKGFRVPAMMLTPKVKKAMAFYWKKIGERVIFRIIYRKAYSVPAKPWLTPAYEDVKEGIEKIAVEAGAKMEDV